MPFSLFEGDLLNRRFQRLGLKSRGPLHLGGRIGVLLFLTWFPTALLAIFGGLYSTEIEPRNFFADYAAYMQFFVALPLFVLAESVLEENPARRPRRWSIAA